MVHKLFTDYSLTYALCCSIIRVQQNEGMILMKKFLIAVAVTVAVAAFCSSIHVVNYHHSTKGRVTGVSGYYVTVQNVFTLDNVTVKTEKDFTVGDDVKIITDCKGITTIR